MNQEEIIELAVKSAADVLEQMAFLDIEAKPAEVSDGWRLNNQIAASLGFKGEYTGTMIICCSEVFSREATANLLGLDDEELKEEHIVDNIKEMVNIVLGNLLCLIDNQKSLAQLEIPEYFKPEEHMPDPPESGKIFIVPFAFSSLNSEDENDTFFIELSIQHNPQT